MIGQTISHYKILDKLGEGGMGVVYKAQDIRLHRIVALKFLPHHLTANEENKKRFVREARAASALDHPSICTLYELDETDQHQLFIAMAYYEGQTIKDKIKDRPLPMEQVLDVTISIAEGLSKAHEKGITHRDIKSENVMVTNDGNVKIMDFGLANIIGVSTLTKLGATVGTVPYMSPEQARGEEVDFRTDIWSLGVLIYEMITGKLPFRSEYAEAQVYSILNENPQPLTSLRTGIPMELERIVNKCLQKNSKDRYQRVDEVLVDFHALKKSPDSKPGFVTPPVAYRKRQSRTILFISSGTTGLLIVGLGLLLLSSQPTVEINPDMIFRVVQVPFATVSVPGLSHDGKWASFPAADQSGKWDIYFMNLSSGEPRRITTDSSFFVYSTDLSPDGSHIVYDAYQRGSRDYHVFVVSALGGSPRRIAENGFDPRWQPDGERIFYLRGTVARGIAVSKSGKLEVWSVRPNGEDQKLEFIDSVSVAGSIALCVSPDGGFVAWLRAFPAGYEEIFVHELATSKERQLTFDKKNIAEICWAQGDQILFSSNKAGSFNLWAIPSSEGSEAQITKGSGPDGGMKISADGRKLLFGQQTSQGNIFVASLLNGSKRQVTFDDTYKQFPVLSPDAKRIAYAMTPRDQFFNTSAIYICDRDGSNRQRLTPVTESATAPCWSPDGKSIAYGTSEKRISADSTFTPKTFIVEIAKPDARRFVANGSPLAWLNTTNLLVESNARTWLTSIETGQQNPILNDSTFAVPVLGGKYLEYFDWRRASRGHWIVELGPDFFPTGRPRKLLPPKLVFTSPSLNFLIYWESPGELWKVFLPNGKKERIQGSFEELSTMTGMPNSGAISYDGQQIAFAQYVEYGRLMIIENPFK